MNFLKGVVEGGAGDQRVRVGDALLPAAPSIRLPEGSGVVAGLRPERLVITSGDAAALPSRVDLIEPTGLGTVVHLVLGGQDVKLFTTSRPKLAIGEVVPVSVRPQDVCLFDPATGARVRA